MAGGCGYLVLFYIVLAAMISISPPAARCKLEGDVSFLCRPAAAILQGSNVSVWWWLNGSVWLSGGGGGQSLQGGGAASTERAGNDSWRLSLTGCQREWAETSIKCVVVDERAQNYISSDNILLTVTPSGVCVCVCVCGVCVCVCSHKLYLMMLIAVSGVKKIWDTIKDNWIYTVRF